MRSMVAPAARAAYRLPLLAYWLLWVPVLAVVARPVRRLIWVRARPAVLIGGLLAGFLGVLVYICAGQALVNRFAGPPPARKVPLGRAFLRNFKDTVGY